MRTFFVLVLFLTSFFITPARAQEKADSAQTDFSALTMTGEQQVDQVIDPLRLHLSDGRIIQLDGIDIPDLTPYDTGDIGMAAARLLRENLTQKNVKIYQGKSRVNRMGYQLAQLVEKNSGVWIQGLLLSEGFARVRPSKLNVEMAPQMMALEQQARDNHKGLWADPRYAILTPDTAAQAMNDWAIVEGTVRATAMANNTVYLNFGPDWRSDFTIGLPPAIRRTLNNMGVNPLQLGGKTLRVRGWVESYNGPYIELMAPVWLEIMPDATNDALPETIEGSSLPRVNN